MTRTRVLTALVLAPAAIAAIWFLPTHWLAVAAVIVFLAGLWEWFILAEVDDGVARSLLITLNLLLMVALAWGSRTNGGGASLAPFELVVTIGVLWWLLAALWLKFNTFASDHDTRARMYKLGAASLAVVPAWCALVVLHAEEPHGNRWLLTALAIVWAADTGAYFAGRAFGKHKLAPSISPNKTVEGLLGGALAGVLVGMVLGWFAGATPADLPWVALVSAVTVVFSVVGDLFESLLKRHVGAKDSGTLLPGHGGVLDRIDSVLAALPVFALGKALAGF